MRKRGIYGRQRPFAHYTDIHGRPIAERVEPSSPAGRATQLKRYQTCVVLSRSS